MRYAPLLIGIVTAAALLRFVPQESFSPSAHHDRGDETLMYRVTPSQGVRMEVPAGTDEIVIHVVGEVTEAHLTEQPAAHNQHFSFAIRAAIFSTRDSELDRWEVALRSRISREEPPGLARGSHILEAGVQGTDVRVVVLPVADLVRNQNSVLELTAARGRNERLLVRAFSRRRDASVALNPISPASSEDERNLGRIGTGLGWADVPEALLAIPGESERMSATGERSADYVAVRVVLSDFRQPYVRPVDRRMPTTPIGPHKWIAINARDVVRLTIGGVPGQRLEVADGFFEDASGPSFTAHRISADGTLQLEFARPGSRSIVVRTQDDSSLSVHTDQAGAHGILGDANKVRPFSADRWVISPDRRRAIYHELDETRQLSFEVEPEQRWLRFEARAVASTPEPLTLPVRFSYRVLSHEGIIRSETLDSVSTLR